MSQALNWIGEGRIDDVVVVPATHKPRDAFGGQELSDDEWLTRTL
jgi:hypothetical protein